MNASLASLACPRMRAFLPLLAAACLAAGLAHAQLTIDITTSGGRQGPIAVMPLAGDTSQPQSLGDVIAADLPRTGLFKLGNTSGVTPLPPEPSEVNFGDLTARSA